MNLKAVAAAIKFSKIAAELYQKSFDDGDLYIDGNGHDTYMLRDNSQNMFSSLRLLDSEAKRLIHRLDNPCDVPFNDNHYWDDTASSGWLPIIADRESCSSCGGRIQHWTNGITVKAIECKVMSGEFRRFDQPCIYSNGKPNPSAKIRIPSGKMILGGDFRDHFSDEAIFGEFSDENSINHFAGRLKVTERCEAFGFATGMMEGGCRVFYSPNCEQEAPTAKPLTPLRGQPL